MSPKRREPAPRKSSFERWLIKQGKILSQLLIFVPVSLFLYYSMPEVARPQAGAIIFFGVIAIVTGKYYG